MPTTVVHRVRAALQVQKAKTLLLLVAAKAIDTAMLAAVARFPNPVPTLAILLGQINTLEAAQAVVASRSGGTATAARNTARNVLWASLHTEMSYVQSMADANQADAVEIIKSAGFDVAATPTRRDKPILAAELTNVSGAVKLVANAHALTGGSARRVTYNWQYSIDGGHTWVLAPPSPTATTTIAGLPPLTTCSFRVCLTQKGVMQPWSQVVTIIAH